MHSHLHWSEGHLCLFYANMPEELVSVGVCLAGGVHLSIYHWYIFFIRKHRAHCVVTLCLSCPMSGIFLNYFVWSLLLALRPHMYAFHGILIPFQCFLGDRSVRFLPVLHWPIYVYCSSPTLNIFFLRRLCTVSSFFWEIVHSHFYLCRWSKYDLCGAV